MNELSVTEEQTIVGLLRLGWSERRIARETGHHRATIRRCARSERDSAASGAPASPLAEPAGDSKCTSARKVATDLERGRSSCEPHRPFIEAEVAKGRNAMAIYKDLVEHKGLRRCVQRRQTICALDRAAMAGSYRLSRIDR